MVLNKRDLVPLEKLNQFLARFSSQVPVTISEKKRLGLAELQDAIYEKVALAEGVQEQPSCAPNVRHKAILTETLAACGRLREAFVLLAPADLLAVELQTALGSLSDIVGLTTPEDVLEKIFMEFCIGK